MQCNGTARSTKAIKNIVTIWGILKKHRDQEGSLEVNQTTSQMKNTKPRRVNLLAQDHPQAAHFPASQDRQPLSSLNKVDN